MNTIISAEQLISLTSQGTAPRIFDCRFSLQNPNAGLRAYQKNHIPDAMFADMEQDLSSPQIEGVTGRHPLPARKDWLKTVNNWGLSPDQQVVVYDDVGGAGAARLWWMLRWIGHEKVAVLDGGLQAFKESGGVLSTTVPKPTPSKLEVSSYESLPSLTRLVSTNEINPEGQLLIDARSLARFRGDEEPIDPVAGHIPEAICIPYTNNLDEKGHFKSPEELRQIFWEVSATFLTVVCYCGSGVSACHNILSIVHAGLDMPYLYAGSWSEWIADPNREIALGD